MNYHLYFRFYDFVGNDYQATLYEVECFVGLIFNQVSLAKKSKTDDNFIPCLNIYNVKQSNITFRLVNVNSNCTGKITLLYSESSIHV